MTEETGFDLLDACVHGSQMLMSLNLFDQEKSKAALHTIGADASGWTEPMFHPFESLRAITVTEGGEIWGVSEFGNLWSNAQRLNGRTGWQVRSYPRWAFGAPMNPRPWFRYPLPRELSVPTALTVREPHEVLVGDFEGRILSIDLRDGRCVQEAVLATLGEGASGTPYRFVADDRGAIVGFGTMDVPVARTDAGWAPVSVPGLPDRSRFIRGRWRTPDGRILACTSDRLVLAGSSEGFALVAQLREEPFDIATFAGRTYVATMAGLLELDEAGQTVCAADNVAPVLLVPTETALFAVDISPEASGAGEIAVWKGQPDGRLTETRRIRIRRASSGG